MHKYVYMYNKRKTILRLTDEIETLTTLLIQQAYVCSIDS